MDSKKILNLVTIVMFVITVVLLGLFMFGGEVPNQPYTTPVYTSTLLNWAFIIKFITSEKKFQPTKTLKNST